MPPGLPRIAGDGDRLAQVFTNLLDNAIKHTPEGGQIALRAETDHERRDGRPYRIPATASPPTICRVSSSGFIRWTRAASSDRRSGMGLGLAITKQIVEAHGGAIQVASTLGRGTTFTVWLPLPTPDMTTVVGRRPG